jgi:sterol desaturase/sphingolipid hydroxylase (fatty acid hydroxylase superfamily)
MHTDGQVGPLHFIYQMFAGRPLDWSCVGLSAIEGLALMLIFGVKYNWASYFCSLTDFVARTFVVDAFFNFNLVFFLNTFVWSHRLFRFGSFTLVLGIALFLGEEFFFYWYHRCAHRIRWLWAGHKPHHTTNEFNLGIAGRFGWTAVWTGSAIFYVPMVWVGFPAEAIYTVLGLNLAFQFFIHAAWIPKLGPLEYVFNTPSHHRVHHCANPEYLDANFGGVLIIFDRMFGTFVEERADIRPRYGLVEPLRSNNPLVIALHEWWRIGRDLLASRAWRERWNYLFGPPGWKPGSGGLTTAEVRRQMVRTASERPIADQLTDGAMAKPGLWAGKGE